MIRGRAREGGIGFWKEVNEVVEAPLSVAVVEGIRGGLSVVIFAG